MLYATPAALTKLFGTTQQHFVLIATRIAEQTLLSSPAILLTALCPISKLAKQPAPAVRTPITPAALVPALRLPARLRVRRPAPAAPATYAAIPAPTGSGPPTAASISAAAATPHPPARHLSPKIAGNLNK